MPTPRREHVVSKLLELLQLGTSARVERNYRPPVDLATLTPPWFVNVLEGDHTVDHGTHGVARYTLTVGVRLVVGGPDDANLGASLNALYAEVLLAAYRDATLGGLAVDVREIAGETDTDDAGASAAMAMVVTLQIEFETAATDPTVAP